MRPRVSLIRTLLQLRQQPVLREDGLSATCKRAAPGCCVQRRQHRRCLTSNHGPPYSKPPPSPPSMALFQQQMQELQMEQQEIAGVKQTEDAVVSAVTSDHHRDADNQHRLFQEQMEQLQVEREELFGFTHEEHSAWSNYGSSSSNNNNNNHHSADWMKTLQEARRQQQEHHGHHHNVLSDDNDELEVDDDNESRPFSTSGPSSIQPLTHVSSDGSSVHMVDVGMKEVTRRVAVAQSKVIFPANVMQALQVMNDLVGPKGPVLATAKLAGIMAAKYVFLYLNHVCCCVWKESFPNSFPCQMCAMTDGPVI